MCLRRVGIFFDYTLADDSECTELDDWFTAADAMHTNYPLEQMIQCTIV